MESEILSFVHKYIALFSMFSFYASMTPYFDSIVPFTSLWCFLSVESLYQFIVCQGTEMMKMVK